MKVVRIHWDHEPSKLADVEISDGIHTILVLCHPCEYKVGQVVEEFLNPGDVMPTMVDNLQISDSKEPRIEKMLGHYGYKIYATVLDYENSIVGVGGIKFDLGNRIPFWVEEGDVVEFRTSRVDL